MFHFATVGVVSFTSIACDLFGSSRKTSLFLHGKRSVVSTSFTHFTMEARVQQLEKSMQEIQAQLEFVGQMAVGRTEILEIINQKIGSRVIEAVTISHAKKKEA